MSRANAVPVPPSQLDGGEGWQRLTDEPELRDVEAISVADSGDRQWSVTVSVMEFVRDEPLESELRASIAKALRSVQGVTFVAEEDREVWLGWVKPRSCALGRRR